MPAAERRHEQQAGGRVAGSRPRAPGALDPARIGERDAEAGGCGLMPAASATTSPGKVARAHRVGEEREPAQHDPGAEQAAGDRQQEHLEERRCA